MVGVRRKCGFLIPALIQHQQADQSPLCPAAHGGWIGQVRRVFTVRCGLLGSITGGNVLTGLLPAVQGEGRRRR